MGLLAIIAGMALGVALAIGGNDGEEHQAGMDGVFTLPEVGPRLRDENFLLRHMREGSSGDSGRQSARLIFPGIASDGLAEPEVIASAVSDTVAIPDENPGADSLIVPPTVKADVTPVPPSNWTGIDAFLAGSPLEGMGNVFIAAALVHGLDPRLMPAIALWESGLGTAGCVLSTRNPFGLKDAANPGVTCRTFDTYEDAIWAATATFGSYPVDVATGLCWWVAGPSGACNYDYVARVLNTMEGIR